MERILLFGKLDGDFLRLHLKDVDKSEISGSPIEATLASRVESVSAELVVWLTKDEIFELLDGLVRLRSHPTESFSFNLRSRQVKLTFQGHPTGHITIKGTLCQSPGRTEDGVDRVPFAQFDLALAIDQSYLNPPIDAIRLFIASNL